MRKVVLEKPGVLALQEDEHTGEASLGFGEGSPVRIRVLRCGICGADVKSFLQGHRDLIYPRVLGHEIAGVIAYLPEGYKGDLRLGDRVQVYPGSYCGICDYCRSGRENLCDEMKILGFHREGGMADYLEIPMEEASRTILSIPPPLSLDQATLAEPLACCIQMLSKFSREEGRRLLIVGAGRLGLLLYHCARSKGWKDVKLVDSDANRRTHPGVGSILHWDDFAAGGGSRDWRPNQVITATSSVQGFSQAVAFCEKGGQFGYFSGLVQDHLPTKVLNEVHYKELEIHGSYGCTFQGNREALDLLSLGLIPEKGMIRETFSLENAMAGMKKLMEKEIHWGLLDLEK